MNKRILSFLLAFCLLLSPFGAYALSEGTDDAVVAAAEDTQTPATDDAAPTPQWTVTYDPKQQKTPDDLPAIACKAAYVADPASGKVFFEKNAHEKMYPASTTKLLTALLVLEHCTPDETAKVSAGAVSRVPAGYVTANLKAGETHTIRTLLQALLIPSANEAAFVLAEHVGGSVEAFAAMCNERAAELGCENLHFVNPNGIHDNDHYCTAYDLFLVAKACRKYDLFNEIVTMKSVTVPPTEIYPANDRIYPNTNQLLLPSSGYFLSDCTGIKTGYTPQAGECLVASASDDHLDLISVVLGGKPGAGQRFSDSKNLLTYVFDRYAYRLLADKTVPLAHRTVKKATKKTRELDVIMQIDLRAVVPNEITPDNVPVTIDLPEELKAPIRKNQVLGKVTYSVDGFVYTTDLVALHDVVKKPYWLYNLLVVFALFVIFVAMRTVYLKQKRKRKRKRR